jgi:bacterioferritin (cytochrome b1)
MAVTDGLSWWRRFLGASDDLRSSGLTLLLRRYVREKQNAMRYGEHAERMQYPQYRDALRRMAAEAEKHAEAMAEKIKNLGGRLPDVTPVPIGKELNSWHYIKSDLEEEQRDADDLQDELPAAAGAFPDIADLFEQIERDGKKHRTQLRDMLARSDPQSLGPP